MEISIFGAGYVGLVTGACFAELGNQVTCCDVDERKIFNLQKGDLPIYEPGLPELVERNSKEGRLHFTTNTQEAAQKSEVLFIAVGTPQKDSGEANLEYVFSVAQTIGEFLKKDGVLVVTKSTVPAGTTAKVKRIIQETLNQRGESFTFSAVSNPEFLREGRAVEDFLMPDRVVVGVEDSYAEQVMRQLYAPLTKKMETMHVTSPVSSEMIKYASNTFIAARISLINEISQICEAVGADIEDVRKATGADKRIGPQYLYPGIGYGGSCFPKDVQALAFLARQHNLHPRMIEAIEATNEHQKDSFVSKIIKRLGQVDGKKVAMWGLSFKPKTNDIRHAPALYAAKKLLDHGVNVSAYDPVANGEVKAHFGKGLQLASEMYSALDDAECLIVCTEWPQFREPDFEKIKEKLKNPLIFDGRNIYSPSHMQNLGFSYVSIGRAAV